LVSHIRNITSIAPPLSQCSKTESVPLKLQGDVVVTLIEALLVDILQPLAAIITIAVPKKLLFQLTTPSLFGMLPGIPELPGAATMLHE
jgi:hypothetical protein